MERELLRNWQITGCTVVVGLYRFYQENEAVLGVLGARLNALWLASGTGPGIFGKGENQLPFDLPPIIPNQSDDYTSGHINLF